MGRLYFEGSMTSLEILAAFEAKWTALALQYAGRG